MPISLHTIILTHFPLATTSRYHQIVCETHGEIWVDKLCVTMYSTQPTPNIARCRSSPITRYEIKWDHQNPMIHALRHEDW